MEVLRSKDEAFTRFRKIKARAEVKKKCKLLTFRSDRGGELTSGEFDAFCDENRVEVPNAIGRSLGEDH